MSLFHVTRRVNMDSITRQGIDPTYAVGKIRAVWLVSRFRLDWAILHVCQKYNLAPADVVIYECLIPEEGRTRRWQGIFSYDRIIGAEDVVRVTNAVAHIMRQTESIKQ